MNVSSTTSQPIAPVKVQAVVSSEASEAPGVNDADDMAGSSAPDVRAAPPAGQGTVIDRVA
ncbi:MAG: hypothetical protein ACOH2M_21300 [Cypionkella sp.]